MNLVIEAHPPSNNSRKKLIFDITEVMRLRKYILIIFTL